MKSSEIFSNNLTLLRIERELDRTKASKGIGISYQYLKELECGKKNPTFETIDKICKFYEIEPYLLFWKLEDL